MNILKRGQICDFLPYALNRVDPFATTSKNTYDFGRGLLIQFNELYGSCWGLEINSLIKHCTHIREAQA
jgi:hypothetical protein